jgi:hypothetical protein
VLRLRLHNQPQTPLAHLLPELATQPKLILNI